MFRAATSDRYETAVDLLTRTDEASDFTPNVSIFEKELDPRGHRKIEDLLVRDHERAEHRSAHAKGARAHRPRGSTVCCILVKQNRLLEWSREVDTWRTLPESDLIVDVALVEPIPVRALLDAAAAAAGEVTARAMLAKHHLVVEAALAEQQAKGEGRNAQRSTR